MIFGEMGCKLCAKLKLMVKTQKEIQQFFVYSRAAINNTLVDHSSV